MAETDDSPLRAPSGLPGRLLAVYCFALSASHLVFALYPGIISEFQRNVLHFAGFAFLASVLYPLVPARKSAPALTAADLALGAATAAGAFWFVLNDTRLYGENQPFGPLDWAAAILVVLGAIELDRKSVV